MKLKYDQTVTLKNTIRRRCDVSVILAPSIN